VAKLSVVVPFYNVEPYLQAALESVARQTFRDLEVIMVDDGSDDGSTVIAKSYAARDPRFRLVQDRNQGPGLARNTGVRLATGQYLAFLDGDDLLAPHAYHLLVGSLEKTGSDIACGGVLRFSPASIWASPAHSEIFATTVQRTHASRYPVLLQDRTPWNKVFRRSFWDSCGLEFPPGLYEDAPPMVRAHVMAASVDVFRDIVYYWRLRAAGELSTTQRTRELSNIEDRMTSLRTIGAFLAASAPALKPSYDSFALDIDIPILASAIELASDDERQRIMELAAGYLQTVDEAVYPRLLAIRRLYCYLMRAGMLPELLEVLRFWRRCDGGGAPAQRDGAQRPPRWHVQYPFFRDPARGIPDSVYDVTDEMKLKARLDTVTWRGGKLRIEGSAYIRDLDAPDVRDTRIRVMLRNSRTRRTIRLRVTRIRRPDITSRSGQATACHDWSGFAVEVSPRRLATLPGVWRAANWELMVQVSGAGISRKGPISEIAPGSAQWPEGRWVKDGIWIQPSPEADKRFVIRGLQVGAFATGCRASDGLLEIEGWSTAPLSPDATLIITPRRGEAPAVRVPAEAAGPQPGRGQRRRGRAAFRAQVPVARLISSAEKGVSHIDHAIHVHDEVICDISLDTGGGGRTRLAAGAVRAGAQASHQGRELTVFVTQFGYLSVLERSRRPVVTQLEWTPDPREPHEQQDPHELRDRRLILRGTDTGPVSSRPAGLLLRHNASTVTHTVPLAWDGSHFTAGFSPGRMPAMAGDLPLASGGWNVLARTGEGEEVTVAVARSLLPDLPGYIPVGLQEIAPQPYRTDALRLNVRTALADDERGRFAQRRLQLVDYPAVSGRAPRDLAVFSSFGGRQCSCNPRAIYEEMRRRNPDLDCAWVTAEGQFSAPEGARLLLEGSRAHYEAMARARYLIFNDLLPTWFRKRDHQTCLQTWRGTPLKHIGLDIERPQFTNGLIYPDLVREDAARWDLLLSQNAFSTPVFRRAFGFHGEIMETGYPRNDLLRHPRRDEFAADARERLGLPAGQKVVLYAPTWRDDAMPEYGGYRFSLKLDTDAAARCLGDEYVLLLRMHSNIRGGSNIKDGRLDSPGGASVLDVTGYPDIASLLLITDILITDYSSVMFDFALTGRPMLFFTYDLERYRDALRGFCLDFEAEAPGPLLSTSAEVIEALRDPGGLSAGYREAYHAFAAKYCALDDGGAAGRVVDRLFRAG
jgi:CDP-glycerol glycerophosphotransferase